MRTENKQIYSGTVTTNGNSYSTPINVKNAGEIVLEEKVDPKCQRVLFLDVTDVQGNTPGLIVYLMTQDPISEKWFLIGNFDNKTAIGTDITFIINGIGSTIACSWAVSGVDPSFTFALNASIKD